MLRSTRLSVGSKVVAMRDFGPVVKGQLGIVTHVVRAHRLFWRRLYICTFLGDVSAVAQPDEIERFDHGIKMDMLKDPLWFKSSRCWRNAYGAVPARRALRLRGQLLASTERSDRIICQDDEPGQNGES